MYNPLPMLIVAEHENYTCIKLYKLNPVFSLKKKSKRA